MKHILAENMRRFGTKNLSEQTADLDPNTLTPTQQMMQWATQFIKQHGFKLDAADSTSNGKVYKHGNLRGVVAIEITALDANDNQDMLIRVERSGTKRATFNNSNEEYLWDERYLGKEWDAAKASQIDTVLKPYL